MKYTIYILALLIYSFNALATDLNLTASLIPGINGITVVTVGPDGSSCDFNSGTTRIQDAIDSNFNEVRIASSGTYNENIVIDDKSIIIKGGYANCSDALNGIQTTTTLITGVIAANKPLIHIIDNTGNIGGGIYCNNQQSSALIFIQISGESGISNNQAVGTSGIDTGKGGGVFLKNCPLTLYSGAQSNSVNDTGTEDGGGAYITDNLTQLNIYTGLISANVVNADAGIFAFFNGNGGAISVNNDATLLVKRLTKECWNENNCNLFNNNFAPSVNGFGSINCTIAHEDSSIPVQMNSSVAGPMFVDAINNDYRIDPINSPAIDYCFANNSNNPDMDFET